MNPDRLLRYFDRIIDVPDAMPQLRRFILDLAVRAKLVEQNPGDEPASELLGRIKKEKAQIGRTGKLFQPRRVPLQHGEDLPCVVPTNWEWCRLSDLSLRIHYGFTASADFGLQEVRLLRITDIQNNTVNWESVPGCQITDKEVEQYLLADGDVLIARTGGTIGKSFLVKNIPVKAVFASYLIRVQGSHAINERYLKLFLESSVYWNQLNDGARGAGQPKVNGQTLGNMAVSLPPLAEQYRIVAKVDELMALCDELEAQLTTSASARSGLLEALLHEALTPHL
jgi:type I restriction enzyme, S subunit